MVLNQIEQPFSALDAGFAAAEELIDAARVKSSFGSLSHKIRVNRQRRK